MRVIVTCGPSYEPVDEVRRLTNFSTGELGTLLAAALARAGYETLCLRGAASTWPDRPHGAEVRAFTTNDDLAAQLRQLAGEAPCVALFHTAALADFRVAAIGDATGQPLPGAKISSAFGPVSLLLEPATKLLPQLRAWFPATRLVGWKYELDGTRAEAIARAARQIAVCRTDACVLNGRAYGAGFGILHPDDRLDPVESKAALCEQLIRDFLKKA
jgi:phosphopantothenoylcysteine synthetase/decarboxylase